VADEVATFVRLLRAIEPDVVVGDIEPMWSQPQIGAEEMAAWLDAFEAAAGEPFAFLHLDSDWARPDWAQVLLDVSEVALARGVPIGVIYFGGDVGSDAEWIRLSAQRMFEYEQLAGGTLAHVVVQSWNDHPYRTLPESDPDAMTSLVNRYFGSRPSITVEQDGSDRLIAMVVDESGTAIEGLPVDFDVTPLDGAPQTWTLDGVTPDGAVRALVQLSVNDGVAAAATTDVVVNAIGVTGGTDGVNLLQNGAFDGLTGWGPYGEGEASVESGIGLRLTASSDQTVLVDSAQFTIAAGAPFRLIVTAEVPAQFAGTTRVSLIFLGDGDVESGRAMQVLAPFPERVGDSMTDATGTAVVATTGLGAGRYLLRATERGDLDRWPAYADTELSIP
jgi:hypothetical protein